jgi:hypothetical protein
MKKERLRGMPGEVIAAAVTSTESRIAVVECAGLAVDLSLISEDNSDGRRMMHMDYKQRRGVSAQHAA